MKPLPLLALAALVAAAVACSSGGASSPTPTVEATPTNEARATSTSTTGGRDSIALRDPVERDRVRAALAGLAGVEVSDEPLPNSSVFVVQSWAAVTDQRRDVLELTLDELRRALRGEVADWSAFGGTSLPLTVEVPATDADAIARALDVALGATVLRKPLAFVRRSFGI